MGNNKLVFKLKKEAINDKFLPELSNYDTRLNVFYGGAGSGKSHFVVQKMIFKYLSMPGGRRCLVVRKVQNTLRDSIFKLFVDILKQWDLYDLCDIKTSYLEITLPNGSAFIFKGLDDPEKIKSIAGIDDIIVEEATELAVDDLKQLGLRLRSKKPNNQIHLMFNPISKSNWVYKRWFDKDNNIEIDNNVVINHSTYRDNKFLPQSYIDDIEQYKLLDYDYYKIYALGEFATLDKLVYNTNVYIDNFNYIDMIRKDKNNELEALFGLDFGYSADPSAFVAILHNKGDKKIYIYDEFYERGLLNNEIANEIIKRGYRKESILADSASPKDIAELRELGISNIGPAKKGPGSILNGIQYLKQHEIIVHPSCVNILEEFKNYTFKKDRNREYLNEPVDNYNHALDALRYALSKTHTTGKINTFNRSLLF